METEEGANSSAVGKHPSRRLRPQISQII